MNDSIQKKIDALLRSNSVSPDVLEMRTLTQLFLSQMRIALYGGKSSIPVLPTFLKPFGSLPDDRPIAVAELTEQEVRAFLVTFRKGKANVVPGETFPIPGQEYPAPLEDVLYAAAELLEPFLAEAKGVALCLPFPVAFDGKGDGSILRFPGSMTVTDFEAIPVLATLTIELRDRGYDLPAVLVPTPDAVQLTAGVLSPKQSRYLGLLWGGTIDLGFAAPGSIVLRWLGIDGSLMLFDAGLHSAECVPFGMADLPKDRDCYGPGLDLLNKIVSTDYLGDTFRLVMIKAAENKLLSFGCSRDILSLTKLGLDAVLDFLRDPVQGGTIAHFCREPEDREVGLVVAHAVLDRAARLVCAALSAGLLFVGAGKDPAAPACIGVWGEAFSLPLLRAKLEHHLDTFVRDTLGLHVRLTDADPILGSAAAALYGKAGTT